jgi:hypothetical protein
VTDPPEFNRYTDASDVSADATSPTLDMATARLSRRLARDAATARLSRRLIRVGWWICVGGVPVTLLGSRLIAAGGKSPSAFAQLLHTVGLVTILAGLLIALSGYRTPWFVNFIEHERRLYTSF